MSVAVIGAGASGLPAVKCCLDEGLEPTCFEKRDYIGGLWHYSPDVVTGQSSVIKSTVCNVSKEMMCYSDFPPPKEFPPYMHNKDTDAYLGLYADKFGLRKYIRTNHEVVEVKESFDHDSTGRWRVRVKKLTTGTIDDLYFDFVMVCSGIFNNPNIPEVQGLSDFKGNVLHSHDYREGRGFEDQNVLVVGFGNSAGDTAVDVSSVAKQVYVSSRSGAWVFSRLDRCGLPMDLRLSRALTFLQKMAPGLVKNFLQSRLNDRVDHKLYSFNPKMDIWKAPGFMNDLLPFCVLHGAIKIKPNIKGFTQNGIEFEDGTSSEIDTVIFATGYHVAFPFLSDDVIGFDKAGFYKGIFPSGRRKNTLAIIGCLRIKGGAFPVNEMQSRVAARVFKGYVKLPSNEKMLEDIAQKKETNKKFKSPNLYFVQQEDYVSYLDELAGIIGCKPKLGRLLLWDFPLAKKCIFGPCTPYTYRLSGPCPWDGARGAIMTLMDRIYYPLNPDYKQEQTKKSSLPLKLVITFIVICLLLFFLFS